jgi:NADPH:quinone reductase-like Zn-dependent oxidoreductase
MQLPHQMTAALLTGYGGFEKLVIRDDVPLPSLRAHEVLIRVGACGVNNTDINTRKGWYAPTVQGATDETTVVQNDGQGAWSGGLSFPRIQGADVVGRIAAVGDQVSVERIGERVIVEPVVRNPQAPDDRESIEYLGSERDGGFAEYVAIPAANAFPVHSGLSDAELATFPCSYSTAEHMLTRIRITPQDTLLITGASGGVGSALVQPAKRRGATVAAVTSAAKKSAVAALGADMVIDRRDDLATALRQVLPEGRIDAVADVVGGNGFPHLIEALRPGGRYVTSGAIAGPIVSLDLRQLYLKDLEFQGATVLPPGLFSHLVGYIEQGEIRPLLAGEFPLTAIREAQEAFMAKNHIGNFVLRP